MKIYEIFPIVQRLTKLIFDLSDYTNISTLLLGARSGSRRHWNIHMTSWRPCWCNINLLQTINVLCNLRNSLQASINVLWFLSICGSVVLTSSTDTVRRVVHYNEPSLVTIKNETNMQWYLFKMHSKSPNGFPQIGCETHRIFVKQI